MNWIINQINQNKNIDFDTCYHLQCYAYTTAELIISNNSYFFSNMRYVCKGNDITCSRLFGPVGCFMSSRPKKYSAVFLPCYAFRLEKIAFKVLISNRMNLYYFGNKRIQKGASLDCKK